LIWTQYRQIFQGFCSQKEFMDYQRIMFENLNVTIFLRFRQNIAVTTMAFDGTVMVRNLILKTYFTVN